MTNADWDQYLDEFHAERPGITEAILLHAHSAEGSDPYEWMHDALRGPGPIIDIACGSGPLASRATQQWIGLDRSLPELNLAAAIAPGRVAVGDASSPPFRPDSASTVACSMALMVFDEPRRALVSLAGLLQSGGRLVALLPAKTSLTLRDRVRYASLLTVLGLRHFPFRHQQFLDNPQQEFTAAGLEVLQDDTVRFIYRFGDAESAARWLRSLYLPDLSARRHHAARWVLRGWAGSTIGLPLRRIVAAKPDSGSGGIVDVARRVGEDVSPEESAIPQVVFFWRPGCGFCWRLRRNLTRAGVILDERNIWDDRTAAAFVRSVANGNETVPTVVVRGEALVNPPATAVLSRLEHAGFRTRPARRRALLRRLLDRNRIP